MKPVPNYDPIVNAKGEKMNLLSYLGVKNKDPNFGILLEEN